jgi:hypothetical protein
LNESESSNTDQQQATQPKTNHDTSPKRPLARTRAHKRGGSSSSSSGGSYETKLAEKEYNRAKKNYQQKLKKLKLLKEKKVKLSTMFKKKVGDTKSKVHYF